MCRLFGMSGGRRRMRATSWLLEAPDSLAEQMDGLDDLDPRAAASQRHATQRRETDASS